MLIMFFSDVWCIINISPACLFERLESFLHYHVDRDILQNECCVDSIFFLYGGENNFLKIVVYGQFVLRIHVWEPF